MSTGTFGSYADDQERIFIEGPPSISSAAFGFILLGEMVIAAIAAYAARESGSGWITAALAGCAAFVVVSPVAGAIIWWRLRHRRDPLFSLAAFDVIRDAGNQALAAFRVQHPTIQHVQWALCERRDDGCVIRVDGVGATEASGLYLVGSPDTRPRELDDHGPGREREIFGFLRSQCIGATQAWRRGLP